MTIEELEALPTGAELASHHGNRWRKRPDGQFDCLSDPGWGPHSAAELPRYVTVITGGAL